MMPVPSHAMTRELISLRKLNNGNVLMAIFGNQIRKLIAMILNQTRVHAKTSTGAPPGRNGVNTKHVKNNCAHLMPPRIRPHLVPSNVLEPVQKKWTVKTGHLELKIVRRMRQRTLPEPTVRLPLHALSGFKRTHMMTVQ